MIILMGEFSQARELTFGLLDEKGEVDFDGFVEHFADELRKEPWVARVMDRSPTESPGGIEEVRTIALPMLLNLESADFDRAFDAALREGANGLLALEEGLTSSHRPRIL